MDKSVTYFGNPPCLHKRDAYDWYRRPYTDYCDIR